MLTERQKRLFELLVSQQDFQTVEFLSSKLGVSSRTVHSELEEVQKHIERKGGILEKKRGVGILYKKDHETGTPPSLENEDLYNLKNRRMKIMELLLFSDRKVSFNSLSEKFLVSKTSIIKDLEFIMSILKIDSNLQLKSDITGTELFGNEEDIQKAHLQFVRYVLHASDYCPDDVVEKKIKLLEGFYGSQVISVCSNILYSFIRENLNAISDHYIQNMLNIFVVLVYRISNGHHIKHNNNRLMTGNQQFFDDSAVKMIHKASLRLGFSYENTDVEYLSMHLVSNRVKPVPDERIDTDVTEALIEKVSALLSINFSDDAKLEDQLKKHIPAMIYRLKSHNKTDNPFVNQIKQEFSLTFNVIWLAVSEFEEQLQVTFNEEEISFLTMYFQAAIERANRNKKLLIICQMGIATSELLMNRIKNVIPSLDRVEVASLPELEQMDIKAFDLIISTIKINVPDVPVILVSPLLTNEDVEKIKQSGYRPSMVKQQPQAFVGSELGKHLNKEMIVYQSDFSTSEELINTVGQSLIDNRYVTEAFIESLKEREKLGGTDLPSGTATPHGNPTFVNETIVALVKNKKKIKWDKYYVDIVFVICIAPKDKQLTRSLLSDVYNVVDNKKVLSELRKQKSKQAFINVLGSDEFDQLR